MKIEYKKLRAAAIGFSVVLINIVTAFSQDHTADSLRHLLNAKQDDTAKVNILNTLSQEFRYKNSDSLIYYANKGLLLAGALNYKMGIADAKLRLAAGCADMAKYDEGVENAGDAVLLYQQLLQTTAATSRSSILKKLGNAYNVMSHNRSSQGNFVESIKYSLLALEVREQIGDKPGVADTEFNIGLLYCRQANYTEGLKHLNKSAKLYEALGNKGYLAGSYSTIGLAYFEMGNLKEASGYYTEAEKLALEAGDLFNLGDVYINLGALHVKKGSLAPALEYNFKALKLFNEIKNNEQIPFLYNNIGSIYTKQKNYVASEKYLQQALSYAREINNFEYIRMSYENLLQLDSAQGNFKRGFEHQKLAAAYKDSITNKENTRKIVELRMQYAFNKKVDSLNQSHTITVTKLDAQKRQQYLYWTGLALLLALSFFIFRNFLNQKKINKLANDAYNKQKAELELQNQKSLLSERLRISSELHDEVGATLSGIALYTYLAREQMKFPEKGEIENSLSIIQSNAGEMVNKLNDIVWLINPGHDSLQQLMQRLEDYAAQMAAVKNMQFRSNVNGHYPAFELSTESRRNIYLLFKEAVNNAVKYSHATQLELTFWKEENTLLIQLKDNGTGFDLNTVKRGNGLNNIQQRANEAGIQLRIVSGKNEGTSITAIFKIP